MDIINLILNIAMFIMGTVLGSFFTLAVYRIPLKKDITHERSFCPNCNHRLEFLDLIPILSYIFLGGKCRYCKQKIRPRYLILEVFSGIIFMLFFMSLKIDILNLSLNKIVYLIFGILFISTLFIIGGIGIEKHYIPNSVLTFGLVILAIYIIYLYILHASIYKYVIYFIFMFACLIANIVTLKNKTKIL
ncbi:MAG: prepilin peptidase [Clostridia bacterium]|nr:prepilin peptidase [Clostridia bacterium]